MSLSLAFRTSTKRRIPDAIADIVSTIEATRPAAQKAANRALRESARWFVTQTKREIAAQTKVPSKALSPRIRAGKLVRSNIVVTLNLSPIRAKFLGPLTQLKPGAKAGRFYFPGAFVATMSAARGESIYRRKGRPRFPVSEQGVAIAQPAHKAATTFAKQLPAYYERRWKHHLAFQRRQNGS